MPTRTGVFFYAKFDLPALLRLAEQLRNIPCSCDSSKHPESGSWNWTIFLLFEDGVEWVLLSPRQSHDISPETTAKLIKSAVATMKYVRLNSPIPVPEVFDYSATRSDTIGIPFILMSKAPGFPLSRFSWDACPEGMVSSRKPRPFLRKTSKEKILTQLGTITSQLLNLRFDKIGSLFEEDGEYRVEECLSPALIWHRRDSLGGDVARGPFQRDHEYYDSLVSAFLLHVKELPLEQHAFFAPIPELKKFETFPSYRSAVSRWNDFVTVGSKIDNSKNRLDYCIAGHFLRKMIPAIDRQLFATLGNFETGFPLYHPDLSMGNIFVDDDFNITCIIDWAFSSTVPISTLFMTPGLPHPRDQINATLASTFRASFPHPFFQGHDIKIGPEFWKSTRQAWLFTRLVTLDGLQDYRYFTELYASVYSPDDEINIPMLFKDVQKEKQFVELARTLAEDDLSESKIQRDEEDYFRFSDSGRQAIARKLTIVTELSKSFVADERLWRWIEKVTT
ncbi:hypothetical protein BDZ45DRAFT_131931 [Acephala macrosclerotiorum]|nr:hypothetical protein BDZ45DRAFT_131931 [Acephala macrosclerotiorum]